MSRVTGSETHCREQAELAELSSLPSKSEAEAPFVGGGCIFLGRRVTWWQKCDSKRECPLLKICSVPDLVPSKITIIIAKVK